MSVWNDLYHGTNRFDFPKLWRFSLPFAAALTLAAGLLVATKGLSLGIDFEGGGVWEVPASDVSVGDARSALGGVGLNDARIQQVQDASGRMFLRVQAGTEALERQDDVTATLAQLAGTTADEVTTTTVGPTWGDEITRQAIRATIYFFIAVAIYLSWRLEWRMAVGALAAVVHDLAVTAAVYSLFGFEVTPATVIALLTILGYSLYDTVVVFDKILEHRSAASRVASLPYAEMVSQSTNQVLMRSLNTTISTLLPVVSMLIVGSVLLGGATLQDFSLALFVGLLAGAYSSIFVAAPLLVVLHGRDLRLGRGRGDQRSRGRAVGAGGARRPVAPNQRPRVTTSAGGEALGRSPVDEDGPDPEGVNPDGSDGSDGSAPRPALPKTGRPAPRPGSGARSGAASRSGAGPRPRKRRRP